MISMNTIRLIADRDDCPFCYAFISLNAHARDASLVDVFDSMGYWPDSDILVNKVLPAAIARRDKCDFPDIKRAFQALIGLIRVYHTAGIEFMADPNTDISLDHFDDILRAIDSEDASRAFGILLDQFRANV